MGNHGAIADTGETIEVLHRDRLNDLVDDDQIALASPVDEDLSKKVRLILYPYAIEASSHNEPAEGSRELHDLHRREPLRIDLRYLLAAHSITGNGRTTTRGNTLEELRVLGCAIQVLQDHAVISASHLQGSLATGNERLQASVLPESTDLVINVGNTSQSEPFRSSATYLVTPVAIGSRREAPIDRVEQFPSRGAPPDGGPQ